MIANRPNPIDVFVGSRIRLHRVMLELSPVQLGQQLGMTFEQVLKYENGSNRISATILYEFSRVLNVPVAAFFNINGPAVADLEASAGLRSTRRQQGFALNKALTKIKHRKTRQAIIDLAKSLAKGDDDQDVDRLDDAETSIVLTK